MKRILLFCVICTNAFCTETSLPHRVRNCEIEIEMLRNSISSQEGARLSVEKELSSLIQATKEAQQEAKASSSTDKISKDCVAIKAHANELSKTINDISKRLQVVGELSTQNSQAIKDLELALRALTAAMSKQSTPSQAPTQIEKENNDLYIVKTGDSLEKIAKSTGVSVDHLKAWNQIKGSTIRVGQKLTLRQP